MKMVTASLILSQPERVPKTLPRPGSESISPSFSSYHFVQTVLKDSNIATTRDSNDRKKCPIHTSGKKSISLYFYFVLSLYFVQSGNKQGTKTFLKIYICVREDVAKSMLSPFFESIFFGFLLSAPRN